MGRFSDIDIESERSSELMRLLTQSRSFRSEIATDAVSQEDVDDFCTCLKSHDFYEFVKLEFPLLDRQTDLAISHEHAAMAKILAAAEAHLPPVPKPLMADHFPTLLGHKITILLSDVVRTSAGTLSADARARIAHGVRPIFECLGAAVPEHIDDALKALLKGNDFGFRRYGWKKAEGTAEVHPGSKAQSASSPTETGVYNGGNTCYQSVAFRMFLSSPAIMQAFNSAMGMQGVAGTIARMFDNIADKKFRESKQELERFWQEQRLSKSQFAPGTQQDVEEFLTSFLRLELPEFMMPAWDHVIARNYKCIECDQETTRLDPPNMIYSVALPRSGHVRLDQLLTRSFDEREALRRVCTSTQCGGEETIHSVLEALQFNGHIPSSGDEGESMDVDAVAATAVPDDEKEILIRLMRFNESGGYTKVTTRVAIPRWLFALPGLNKLFYVRNLVTHKGPSLAVGHYYNFERSGPAEEDAVEAEGAVELVGLSGPEKVRELGKRTRRREAQASFAKWTKYEDRIKSTNRPFADVESESTDWYVCLLAPVQKADIVNLLDTVAFKTRQAAYEAIQRAYDQRLRIGSVLDADGPVVPAVTALLEDYCNALGRQLQSENDTDARGVDDDAQSDVDVDGSPAWDVGFGAFTSLNGEEMPSSQDRRALRDLILNYAIELVSTHFDRRSTDDDRARQTYQRIADSETVAEALLKAAQAWIEQQSAKLLDKTWQSFKETGANTFEAEEASRVAREREQQQEKARLAAQEAEKRRKEDKRRAQKAREDGIADLVEYYRHVGEAEKVVVMDEILAATRENILANMQEGETTPPDTSGAGTGTGDAANAVTKDNQGGASPTAARDDSATDAMEGVEKGAAEDEGDGPHNGPRASGDGHEKCAGLHGKPGQGHDEPDMDKKNGDSDSDDGDGGPHFDKGGARIRGPDQGAPMTASDFMDLGDEGADSVSKARDDEESSADSILTLSAVGPTPQASEGFQLWTPEPVRTPSEIRAALGPTPQTSEGFQLWTPEAVAAPRQPPPNQPLHTQEQRPSHEDGDSLLSGCAARPSRSSQKPSSHRSTLRPTDLPSVTGSGSPLGRGLRREQRVPPRFASTNRPGGSTQSEPGWKSRGEVDDSQQSPSSLERLATPGMRYLQDRQHDSPTTPTRAPPTDLAYRPSPPRRPHDDLHAHDRRPSPRERSSARDVLGEESSQVPQPPRVPGRAQPRPGAPASLPRPTASQVVTGAVASGVMAAGAQGQQRAAGGLRNTVGHIIQHPMDATLHPRRSLSNLGASIRRRGRGARTPLSTEAFTAEEQRALQPPITSAADARMTSPDTRSSRASTRDSEQGGGSWRRSLSAANLLSLVTGRSGDGVGRASPAPRSSPQPQSGDASQRPINLTSDAPSSQGSQAAYRGTQAGLEASDDDSEIGLESAQPTPRPLQRTTRSAGPPTHEDPSIYDIPLDSDEDSQASRKAPSKGSKTTSKPGAGGRSRR